MSVGNVDTGTPGVTPPAQMRPAEILMAKPVRNAADAPYDAEPGEPAASAGDALPMRDSPAATPHYQRLGGPEGNLRQPIAFEVIDETTTFGGAQAEPPSRSLQPPLQPQGPPPATMAG